MQISELEEGILDIIPRAQSSHSSLIISTMNVHDKNGLSCSFRQGSTSESLNREVTKIMIDRNN